MKVSGVVWLGAKLREEPLKTRTRYMEWYGERNMVDFFFGGVGGWVTWFSGAYQTLGWDFANDGTIF